MLSLSSIEPIQSYPGIVACRHVSSDVLSDETMDLARGWLEECTSSHGNCQQTQIPALPTRVIDVGADGKDPYLYISLGARGRYATLSHCWGQGSPLITTESTLEQRKEGIPFELMPKTYQDAVTVTRRLRLRFLWIDSLCILQGSQEDWMREAMQMEDIYAQGEVNISAEVGADSHAGLNGSRKMAGVEIGTLEPGIPIFVRPFPTAVMPYAVTHRPRGHGQSEPYALDTRGWVLQERLLSPRILHFADHEIAWECDTAVRCECNSWPAKPSTRLFRAVIEDQGGIASYQATWKDLVETYTSLDLTFQSDKLTAFAGLASRAAKRWSMTYIKGLWKEDFPYSLFWRVRLEQKRYTRRLDECQPSVSLPSRPDIYMYLDIHTSLKTKFFCTQ